MGFESFGFGGGIRFGGNIWERGHEGEDQKTGEKKGTGETAVRKASFKKGEGKVFVEDTRKEG